MKSPPLITVALCFFAGALHLLPDTHKALLYFDLAQLHGGNALGLLFGHWLHADIDHLVWNVSALVLLGGMLEQQSRRLFIAALAAGTVFVDLWLLSPLGSVEQYCGLSGILNTVFACLLYTLWLHTRSIIVVLVAALAALKIAVEIALQHSLFTDIAWPPYAPAHLAGMLGALVVTVILHQRNRSTIMTIRSEG